MVETPLLWLPSIDSQRLAAQSTTLDAGTTAARHHLPSLR